MKRFSTLQFPAVRFPAFARLLVALFTAFFAGLVAMPDADAARLGGGRSIGAQRSITRQAAPVQPRQVAPAPGQAAPVPAQGNRWMGPLAGLAAGLGLGWLFGHGGFGAFGPILLVIVALYVVMLVMRSLQRRPSGYGGGPYGGGGGAGYGGSGYGGAGSAGGNASGYGSRPPSYSGQGMLGNETVAAPPPSQLADPAWGGQQPSTSNAASTAPNIPPGFDVAGFLKQAKLHFIGLQEANDRADLDLLRDVTTDELYHVLADDVQVRSGTMQHTDVVTLDASLLEVTTEANAHWASVRFAGHIREQPGAAPTPFAEVWHLTKPADGSSGWLIAGIEQIA